jgi:hypothetical protein
VNIFLLFFKNQRGRSPFLCFFKFCEKIFMKYAGGDMHGIIGGQIPAIPALELDDEPTKQLPDGSDR